MADGNPQSDSLNNPFDTIRKCVVVWLFLIFVYLVRASFAHESGSAGADVLRAAERLAVVAKYSNELPDELRQELTKAAVEMEEDAAARKVFQGELPGEKDLEALSPTVKLMALQLKEPDEARAQKLADLAAEGVFRLELTIILLLGLGAMALLSLFWPKSSASNGVESPRTLTPWDIFGLFFFWHAGGFVLAGVLAGLWHKRVSSFVVLFLGQMAVYAFMLILLELARKDFPALPLRRFKAAWVGKGYALALLSVFVVNVLTSMISGSSAQSDNPILGEFDGAPLIQYIGLGLLVVVIGPFFEELMFRGWIYGGLAKRWGHTAAMVISAALFAVIHGDAPALPALFVLGLIFAWVYRRSGSLWASILVHAMWNATTFSLLISVMP